MRSRNAEIDVYALARAWEILNMPKGIETINAFSRLVADRMGLTGCLTGQDLQRRNDITGRVVSEGAEIDLWGISVQILEPPGHSSCFISAYVHEINALFPSVIIPYGNSNFTQHQDSLEKPKPLKVDIFCADHYGYVTGREAEGYV